MSAVTPPMAEGAGPTGSIYDLGYRRYDGPRLGRAHAIRSLFFHSVRSAFGIGRGGRAKIAPLTLGLLASIPALAIVAAQAYLRQFPVGQQLEGELPIRYDTYAGTIGIFIILFCAAQAPDLFGRDQRYSLLSLYFARALRRTDYTLARLAGFGVAVFLLEMLPIGILFGGRVLLSTDVVAGALADLPDLGAAAAESALTAGLLGGLSMAVAAHTPRRAYAVAGIIALLLVPNIAAGILVGLDALDVGRWLVLLSPTAVLDGTNGLLFGVTTSGQFGDVDLGIPGLVYGAAAAAWIVGSVAVSVRRFQGITA